MLSSSPPPVAPLSHPFPDTIIACPCTGDTWREAWIGLRIHVGKSLGCCRISTTIAAYRESYKAVQAVNKTQLAALRLFCEFSSSPPRKMTATSSTLNEHSRKFREVVTIASHAFIDVGWNSLSVWYCFDLVFFVARGAMQTYEVESCQI